jgi:hypothetical protein
MPFNFKKGLSLSLNDLFLILVANLVLTVLICLFIPFIFTLTFRDASMNIGPLLILGLLLSIQIYINSWILTIRSVFSLLNILICVIVMAALWLTLVACFSAYLV